MEDIKIEIMKSCMFCKIKCASYHFVIKNYDNDKGSVVNQKMINNAFGCKFYTEILPKIYPVIN